MAFPNAQDARPLFHFPVNAEYESDDAAGHPFDWSETPTTHQKPSRTVLCLIDTHDKPMPLETQIGPFRMGQPDLYFFETEWAQVNDFVSVDIAGETYERIETLLPITLFDVTLYHVRVKTEDKS